MSETLRTLSPALRLKDEAFSPSRTGDYCLSLEIGGDGLALAVLDNLLNRYLVFEQYALRKTAGPEQLADRIGQLAKEHDWLNASFKKVTVMMTDVPSTLVPAAVYDNDQSEAFLRFNHPASGDAEEVRVDHLKNLEAKNIWALPVAIDTTLRRLHPHLRYAHHTTPLIEGLLASFRNVPERRAIAHVQQGRFDVIVIEGRNLLLCNSFRYQTGEDFIYYLLFIFEQLRLNPETTPLLLLGEVNKESAVYGMANKYIRHVQFGSRPDQAVYAACFSELPEHHRYNLFSLHYFV